MLISKGWGDVLCGFIQSCTSSVPRCWDEQERGSPPVRPKLDPFIPVTNQILEDDKRVIKKQRHTAKCTHAQLRDEHGFTGWITIVTD